MDFNAGFSEIEITPPIGTHRIGWIRLIAGTSVLDPLFARVAVFDVRGANGVPAGVKAGNGFDDHQALLGAGDRRASLAAVGRVAIVQLDVLCVPASLTARIRERIGKDHGFTPGNILVSASHNHAGPAVANEGEVKKDVKYIGVLLERISAAFGAALGRLAPAGTGLGRGFEFAIAHNRRVVMRDGTVKTHGTFDDPEALCIEGPVDPEVGVLAVRSAAGRPLGLLVNYALHVTHYGGDEVFTGGFPGVLARLMKQDGWPVTMFLAGAGGNVCVSDPVDGGRETGMEETGLVLADAVRGILPGIKYRRDARLACASRIVDLPYRTVTDDEVKGRVRGAQRFIDSKLYDAEMPELVERIRMEGSRKGEVQAMTVGDLVMVTLPCEPFCELGLAIKEGVYPRRAWTVGYANGMVGYVPTKDAFARGGYETTFGGGTCLAPGAGDLLVDAAVNLVKEACPAPDL